MDNAFADKTETALIAERSAVLAAPAVDDDALRALESEAARRLNAYLAGDVDVDADESPLFYGFIKVSAKRKTRICAFWPKRPKRKSPPF